MLLWLFPIKKRFGRRLPSFTRKRLIARQAVNRRCENSGGLAEVGRVALATRDPPRTYENGRLTREREHVAPKKNSMESRMIVIALGTHGSGSTWCFNAIRALLAEGCPDAVSLFAADTATLLRNVPPGTRNVVVKAHHLDTEMLTLAVLSKAKIVITIRDPRDSLISLRERFGSSLHETIKDLSLAAATLSMLEKHLLTVDSSESILRLIYEERFMDEYHTVERIASFLNIQVDSEKIRAIFEQLTPDKVGRKVDRLIAQGKMDGLGHDDESHLHPAHLGDGESGKWEQRLSIDDQQAVMGALGGDLLTSAPAYSIDWSAKLFNYSDARSGTPHELVDCDGEDRILIWGPYQHLRTGRWQVTPRLSIEDAYHPITIKVDIYIPVPGRETLALRVLNLPASTPERLVMEFDHHDHLEPIELRISSICDHRSGRIAFGGADLKWLGPSERLQRFAGRPVGSR